MLPESPCLNPCSEYHMGYCVVPLSVLIVIQASKLLPSSLPTDLKNYGYPQSLDVPTFKMYLFCPSLDLGNSFTSWLLTNSCFHILLSYYQAFAMYAEFYSSNLASKIFHKLAASQLSAIWSHSTWTKWTHSYGLPLTLCLNSAQLSVPMWIVYTSIQKSNFWLFTWTTTVNSSCIFHPLFY